MIPDDVRDTIFFYIFADCEDTNGRIPITCDEDVPEMFLRNVVIGEIHLWNHVDLVTPLTAELHLIDLDKKEDEQNIVFTGEDGEVEEPNVLEGGEEGVVNGAEQDQGVDQGVETDQGVDQGVEANQGDEGIGVEEVVGEAFVEAITEGDEAIDQGVAEGVAEGVEEAVAEGVEAVDQGFGEGVEEGVAEAIEQGVAKDVTEAVDEGVQSREDGEVADDDSDSHLSESDNEMEAKFESVGGSRNVDVGTVESDGLMSDYLSDDAPLFERESEDDEDDSETKVAEDPMKNYLHRNLYEVAEEENQK